MSAYPWPQSIKLPSPPFITSGKPWPSEPPKLSGCFARSRTFKQPPQENGVELILARSRHSSKPITVLGSDEEQDPRGLGSGTYITNSSQSSNRLMSAPIIVAVCSPSTEKDPSIMHLPGKLASDSVLKFRSIPPDGTAWTSI